MPDREKMVEPEAQPKQSSDRSPPRLGGAYAHYVLFVLVIVYVFNFIDRQILSILSQDIQADLGVTDAQMGFLYGTVFAVFYAVFGIPLARFADVWVRRSLISIGLMFWSAMTALSGFARSFPVLAMFPMFTGIYIMHIQRGGTGRQKGHRTRTCIHGRCPSTSTRTRTRTYK